jgi:receptor expression-enhancing protein 1/2/3/4
MPSASSSPQQHYLSKSRGFADSFLRERTTSGRFEEIEVPSDVEGYDVADDEDGVGHSTAAGRRGAAAGGGWFGGWGPGSKGGYEKVNLKSD